LATALAAGLICGLIFALFFVGHMSIAIVYRMPGLLNRWYGDSDSAGPTRVIFWGIFALVPLFGLAGVGLAALSRVLADVEETGIDPIPSFIYIVALWLVSSGGALLLYANLQPIRRDIVLEYIVFAGIYGFAIPWLANL
jgi:hypothetical protein